MAAIPWPPDLPQCFLRSSYAIAPKDNVLREPMEVGPPKQRRRSTVQVVEVRASMWMTGSQRRNFMVFYRKVLQEGTVAFALDDPDGYTQQYTMNAPPTLAPDGLGWRVDMSLQYIDQS